ncbi:hypothetical protein [Parvimonas micra]|uniref:hypothetical protein n=1 Tax=Parvimonas micra TaxID=33033 RepID=UPI00241F4D11|nr:hypothetical protein [Parvimonas micra]
MINNEEKNLDDKEKNLDNREKMVDNEEEKQKKRKFYYNNCSFFGTFYFFRW